jgi:O-antigen biosynthesis protein
LGACTTAAPSSRFRGRKRPEGEPSRGLIALAAFSRFPVKVVPFAQKFNFSRANNLGVEHAKYDLLMLLNNDTEILDRSWLRDIFLYFEDPGVGAVGPVLLYPDRTVHAGIVLGCRGTADHVMRYFPGQADGYGGSLACSREVTAVTGACLLTSKNIFLEMGGFSEDFANHYQDVDLCLKIRNAGFRIICAARPRLIHHESLTRQKAGYDLIDRAIFVDRWYQQIQEPDPFYNPHLDRQRLDYSASSEPFPRSRHIAQPLSYLIKRSFDTSLNDGPTSLFRKVGAALRNRRNRA